MKHKNGLGYSVAPVEQGHMANIEQMASDDAATAATARLNRDLLNVLDGWLRQESELKSATTLDMLIAATHGLTTVAGTVLMQIPKARRKEVHREMRNMVIGIFDDMGEAVLDEPDRPTKD